MPTSGNWQTTSARRGAVAHRQHRQLISAARCRPGEQPLFSLDDPRARQLMAAAERHLAVSSTAAALREVVNGIDALDVDASHTLQLKLHTLRAAIEQRLVEQETEQR